MYRSLGRHRDALASERLSDNFNDKTKREFPFGANRRAQACFPFHFLFVILYSFSFSYQKIIHINK